MAKRFFPPKEGSAKTGAQAWARNAALAALSGAVGALAGAPWFAIKTRHQVFSTSEGAVGTQHVPKPALKEFAAIARTEGLRGLFRGLDAFMPRVVVFGAVQLATYDVLKAYFADRDFLGSRGAQQVAASVGASLASVTAIQPFDFLAARMMNQPVDPKTGRGLFYSGPWDCAVKSIRAEGPWALFKGYPANLARFGPYTVLVLVFVERLRALEASLRGKDGG
ncbi:mitochondrial carrier domain-containing protein [Hyaloraphidium curvatum]|nr:mitochondrial carrier domain-containing protein [Hyaloraphidium curvatum]